MPDLSLHEFETKKSAKMLAYNSNGKIEENQHRSKTHKKESQYIEKINI